MGELIYLDNNATTRPLPEVVDAMMPCLDNEYANPSSVHQFGQRVRHAVESSRVLVAGLINASVREIVFTSGGTESINLAIQGLCRVAEGKRRVVTSSIEHAATRSVCDALKKAGYEIVEVGVDRGGRLDMDALGSALTDDTALATVLWANNETGVLFDVATVADLCASKGVPLHVDAVQAIGKVVVDVDRVLVTMLSLSGHKFHGPKGVGALYVRKRTRIAPLIVGGGQERNVRGGTENVAGIVGMGVAAGWCRGSFSEVTEHSGVLRDRLEDGILASCPKAVVHGDRLMRLPNTTNIGFPDVSAEGILILLSQSGVCASSGSACSSGALEPSHVLAAMGVDEATSAGAIRFGVSHFTTPGEIDRVIDLMPGLLARLRPGRI